MSQNAYSQAGVDVEAGYEAVSRIKSMFMQHIEKKFWAIWVALLVCFRLKTFTLMIPF